MRFKRHMKLEHGLKQIDIAPLIDMVFQLLIFFMLTSSFVIQPGIKINLPKAVTSESVSPRNVEIIISSENVVYLEGKVINTQELNAFLKAAAKSGSSVLIKADRHAAVGRAVEVLDICQRFGIKQVNIATTQSAND